MEHYRIRRIQDYIPFEDAIGEEPLRAYFWDSLRGWTHLYGERGPKYDTTREFAGYSQGDYLKLHYNTADFSSEALEEIVSVWRDGTFAYILERWDATPGVGWMLEDSIGGIYYTTPNIDTAWQEYFDDLSGHSVTLDLEEVIY